MIRSPLRALLSVVLLAACANDDPTMMDDPRLENPRLEIVGSPAINLRYGALGDLPVRYVSEDGEPIDGVTLDYALVGDAAGSRLGALQVVTDVDGAASMTLTAGDATVMFQVEVTPPVGDAVRFDVSVADEELGGIVVNMTYGGARTLIRFDAYLFEGQACEELDPDAIPTPLRTAASVTDVSARPAFAGLAPGADYTVAVLAYNAAARAAFGCRDGVEVRRAEDTEVNVSLSELAIPLDFAGTYDLDNRFDFGGALPPSVEALLDALSEIGDDDRTDASGDPDYELTDVDLDGYAPEYGVDPGAFVTELAMRQTCRWQCLSGEDYDSCSMVDHTVGDLRHPYEQDFTSWDGAQARFFGGCGSWSFILADVQNRVNGIVAGVLPDFVTVWAQLVSDLARSITDAHILSVLTIDEGGSNEFQVPITHELVDMVVDFTDPLSTPPGMTRTSTFALADAGLTGLTIDEISSVDGDVLTIPDHSFDMSFGQLVLYIYREVLLQEIFGVDSTGALLATWIDCWEIAGWLETSIDDLIWPLSGPSRTTLEGYCEAGLAAAGGLLEDQLAGSLGAEGLLTIGGTARGDSVDDATGRVGELVDGAWAGSFTEDGATGAVTGTFTGVRVAE